MDFWVRINKNAALKVIFRDIDEGSESTKQEVVEIVWAASSKVDFEHCRRLAKCSYCI